MKYSLFRQVGFLALGLLLSLAPVPSLRAKDSDKEAAKSFTYLNEKSVSIPDLLGKAPEDDSAETKAEIEQLLKLQANRTPAEVARALSEVKMTPFSVFGEVLGSGFSPETLPVTAALLKKVEEDTHLISEQAKVYYKRPRPPLQDTRIVPAVELPKSNAFPSGHTTRATCWGLILSILYPDKKEAILARAKLVGQDRMIGGVHFPSDVAAGEKLGQALAEKFLTSPVFLADLAKAKEEIQKK